LPDEYSGRADKRGAVGELRIAYDEEVFGLTEERGAASGMDPTELWRQWLESGTRMWSGAKGGGQDNYPDPTGAYRRWFEGMRELQERMGGTLPATTTAPGGDAVVQQVWQRWFEAAGESWRRGAELSQNATEVLPRWTQMLEEARDNLLAVGAPPSDPLQLATQWYNATSGPFSDFVGDLIEREEFLEPSSRFLQSYASFYKVFKRNSEEYLKSLQLPVRSDITRIAGLVVNIEDKVDNVEEILEEFDLEGKEATTTEAIASLERRIGGLESTLEGVTETGAQTATAGSVQALEGRLDRVEDKLDRLLAALESGAQNGGAQATQTPAEATAIEGTDAGGRITVDDVRKRGES
jgi:hypothetical protein